MRSNEQWQFKGLWTVAKRKSTAARAARVPDSIAGMSDMSIAFF